MAKQEQTSPKVASQAAKVLRNPRSSRDVRSIAASALTQARRRKKSPQLDAALTRLPEAEHEAVILRNFECKSFQEIGRIQRLRARLAQTPEAQIPELQLATQEDWLDASKGALETDLDYRKALSSLRNAVESKRADQFNAALKKFMAAPPGKFPATVDQLASSFDPPVDPALLARWKVVPGKQISTIETDDEFVITQTPVDAELDRVWVVRPSGHMSVLVQQQEQENPMARILAQVYLSFIASGQTLADPAELQAFATTEEKRAVVNALVAAYKSMSPTEQMEALSALQSMRGR